MTTELQALLARPAEELSGRDLDAVVAVECFGHRPEDITRQDGTLCLPWVSCYTERDRTGPDVVIDWLSERFTDYEIRKSPNGICCTVGNHVHSGESPLLHGARGTTLAEAVCRTAVLAARARKREGK